LNQKNNMSYSKKVVKEKSRTEAKNKTPKFIADCHLGKLAKYLRLMGVDTLFFSHIEDDDLVHKANQEDRIIITRDRILSERKDIPVIFLEPTDTKKQLQMLIDRYHLKEDTALFSRCIVCNTPLEVVDKENIIERLPAKVKKHFNYFEYCPMCDRIYWQGDHYRHMLEFLEHVLNET